MGIFNKIFGKSNDKFLGKAKTIVEEINNLEKELEILPLEKLKAKTLELKEELKQGKTLDDILPMAFALTRESAKRTLKQRHYDSQLIGGIVLHQGKIAEMKTGEGKTLSATLAVYLNGLTGKGVHVVTVNDYLARRDAVWMGQIYYALGLSVGCITHDSAYLYDTNFANQAKDKERDEKGSFKIEEAYLRPCQRKEAYGADITYGTNNEYGFDYLRDNMAFDLKEKVQRGFNFAIIDEIDSILIDEARTPLIISQPDLESSEYYRDFARLIPRLQENTDYNIDEKFKSATLTEEGIVKIEKILNLDNIYASKGIKFLHYLEQALRAKVFFKKDREYIVKDGQVIIIDEFTGRLMPGRRYSGGLHQAIEAQENVKVQAESKTLATITFQNYFRLYKKLAGMTGTAQTSAEEFSQVYNLQVVVVPTNKPMVRNDMADVVYKNDTAKWRAIVKEIKEKNKLGQPILVGTRSVERNEYLSRLLQREGVGHQVLNAKNHTKEGEIIAQAGALGAVTVATNMAGRGVDIILGGNPAQKEATEQIKALGGLYVLGTERHEARRIDNQLRGRAGRQGDEGVSLFFVSLEDEILRIFGGERVKGLMTMLKMPEDEPIGAKILSGAIEKAQSKVEGLHFDWRKHVLEYDNIIAKQRNRIYNQRDEILDSGLVGLKEEVLEMIKAEISLIVNTHLADRANFQEIFEDMRSILPLNQETASKIKEFNEPLALIDYLQSLAERALSQKEQKDGQENMLKVLRFALLRTIDLFWCDHLDTLDHLQDSVKLRAYGGKDPLVEYKTESHRLFQEMQRAAQSQVTRTIFKLSIT